MQSLKNNKSSIGKKSLQGIKWNKKMCLVNLKIARKEGGNCKKRKPTIQNIWDEWKNNSKLVHKCNKRNAPIKVRYCQMR